MPSHSSRTGAIDLPRAAVNTHKMKPLTANRMLSTVVTSSPAWASLDPKITVKA